MSEKFGLTGEGRGLVDSQDDKYNITAMKHVNQP